MTDPLYFCYDVLIVIIPLIFGLTAVDFRLWLYTPTAFFCCNSTVDDAFYIDYRFNEKLTTAFYIILLPLTTDCLNELLSCFKWLYSVPTNDFGCWSFYLSLDWALSSGLVVVLLLGWDFLMKLSMSMFSMSFIWFKQLITSLLSNGTPTNYSKLCFETFSSRSQARLTHTTTAIATISGVTPLNSCCYSKTKSQRLLTTRLAN